MILEFKIPFRMINILPYHEDNVGIELTNEIFPTRKFVVELEGFTKKYSESRSFDPYKRRLSTIRPNWTGIAEYNGNRIITHIAIYYAITRFMFETVDSLVETMINEDGGNGLEIVFSKRFDTEGIIKSQLDGSRFYYRYNERKHIPSYEDVENYSAVRESDLNLEGLDSRSKMAIGVLRTFKRVLNLSSYVPDEYSAYMKLAPECRHFKDNYFF